MTFSASQIAHHDTSHLTHPPDAGSAEFGKHLASVCMGCHGSDFSGGPIVGGDPSWPQARNLTPDTTGLKGWRPPDQFVNALAKSQRPDATALRPPMTLMAPYGQRMTEAERQSLWWYLQSLPAQCQQDHPGAITGDRWRAAASRHDARINNRPGRVNNPPAPRQLEMA